MKRTANEQAWGDTASAAAFRAIAELHGDVLFIVDCRSGLPTYMSDAVVALLGYGIEAFAHQLREGGDGPLAALCAGLPTRLQRFANGDQTRLRVVRHIDQARPDGHIVPLEVTSTLILDENGRASVLAGMLRDISAERDRVEQQRRFTSMLNHEFRTPLSTIDGAIQRLEVTGANADEATRQRYRKIQDAVDRLIGMLDDYLSPDRLEEIGRTRQPDCVAPGQLLEDAAQQIRAAGRKAEVDCGDLPASLRCQPQGVRLALKVLVDNALQYAPDDDTILLSGRIADGGVELSVSDHGAGVPVGETNSIFDKGYRGSNAAGPGSGRGLYMARSVVEVHGGHMYVESVVPRGATFKIWLPAQRGTGKRVASEVINSDNSANQHTREGAARRE
jgi:PAS domain S-box-containing protein